MKKVFILSALAAFSALVISCNNHDDNSEITDVYAKKIDSVHIPIDTMALGVAQQLKLYSTFTKGCEGIYSYDYQYTNDSVRTVTNYAYKTNDVCTGGTYMDGSRVNFQPVKKGRYTFKFWAGKDSAGNDTFLVKKIFVK